MKQESANQVLNLCALRAPVYEALYAAVDVDGALHSSLAL